MHTSSSETILGSCLAICAGTTGLPWTRSRRSTRSAADAVSLHRFSSVPTRLFPPHLIPLIHSLLCVPHLRHRLAYELSPSCGQLFALPAEERHKRTG
jgi:hypothetical protein